MVTYVHGKKAAVIHGSLNLSPWMNEARAQVSAETGDTSHFGSEEKSYILGQHDAVFSGAGLYDGTAVGGLQRYMEALIASEQEGGSPVPMTFAPEGVATGGAALMAFAKTTSYDIETVVSDVETMSFEMQANGGMTFGYMYSSTAITTTTATASVDNGAASSAGGTVFAHILSNANTGNVTVALQHSVDNSVWVDLSIQTVVTTGTLTAYRSATFAGTVNRYLRINTTLAGTGAVSVVASASRN